MDVVRQKKVTAVVLTAVAVLVNDIEEHEQAKKRKTRAAARDLPKSRHYFLTLDRMKNLEFRTHFRMTRGKQNTCHDIIDIDFTTIKIVHIII